MPYIKGTYKIECACCKSYLLRAEAVRDRVGYLVHKDCKDEKMAGFDTPGPKIKKQKDLPAQVLNPPGEVRYQTSIINWESIWTNWEDLTVNNWEDM